VIGALGVYLLVARGIDALDRQKAIPIQAALKASNRPLLKQVRA
jgi:hypothetical protein